MRPVLLRVAANAQDLNKLAAEEFVRLAIKAVGEKGLFTVALAGGSTPKDLYSLLANEDEPFRAQLCWEKIHFFWTDERHVSPDHQDSNYRMARDAMLARAPVPSQNVHRIKTEIADANRAAEDYEQTLRGFFSLTEQQFPRFDLILLGLGADGHTASVFPGSDIIKETGRLVVAPWIEKFKRHRITFTLPVLNNAATAIFLVSGAEKAGVLREVLEGDHRPNPLPAQLITATTGNLLWLMDAEAARLLPRS